MREILYLQAGNTSNYVGTHFWNTQESYLNSEDDSLIDPSVLFRETERDGSIDYTPRLLAFDYKSNFGPFARSNLLPSQQSEDPSTWSGSVLDIKQPPIQDSDYVKHLDEGTTNRPQGVRYWSDFNRLFHGIDTFQPIPDKPEWKSSAISWQEGEGLYSRYEQDTELMDGSVRRFLEECSSPQGLQVSHDSADFGAFTTSFLTSFLDDSPKMTISTFSQLSSNLSKWDDPSEVQNILNDAILLQRIRDLSSLTVPIVPPISWSNVQGINLNDRSNLYHTSAIIAAHLESVTLPTRLKKDRVLLSDQLHHLTYGVSSSTRFSHLIGGFPQNGVSFYNLHDFSSGQIFNADNELSRCDIVRGPNQKAPYTTWSSSCKLHWPLVAYESPAYPLPSSFPSTLLKPNGENIPTSTPLFSSLVTTTAVASSFAQYAKACEHILKTQPTSVILDPNVDDIRELVNDLWTMHDSIVNVTAE